MSSGKHTEFGDISSFSDLGVGAGSEFMKGSKEIGTAGEVIGKVVGAVLEVDNEDTSDEKEIAVEVCTKKHIFINSQFISGIKNNINVPFGTNEHP